MFDFAHHMFRQRTHFVKYFLVFISIHPKYNHWHDSCILNGQSKVRKTTMLKNYLKMTFRNIQRHPGFSLINLMGLAIGLACAILILLWVQDELSYDRFHEQSERIGRIIMDIDGTQIPASPGPLAPVMINEFPEIKNAVRFVWGGGILEYEDKQFEERNTLLVESNFFNIFTYPFIKGDPQTALNDPGSLVLTETTAKKYFGDQDPMGQTIQYSGRVDRPLKVTGVLKDVPHNSTLKFNVLASFEICRNWKEPDSWTSSQDYQTYVLLEEHISLEKANQALDLFCDQYFAEYNIQMFIQPLNRIHLHSHFKFDTGHGDFLYVALFSLIALVVLFIACINFMNLTTAHFTKRAKEVGIRKVVGANRSQLVTQFFTESMIFTGMAFVLAFFLVELSLPLFRNITEKPLSLNFLDGRFLLASIGLFLLTGLLSGSYPSVFFPSFRPANILKDSFLKGRRSVLFRKTSVILQFSLSIMVIISTIIVSTQLDFMRNKKLGFDKESLVYLRTGSYFSHKYEVLRQDLLQSKNIINLTVSNDLPTYINLNTGADWEGKTEDQKYIGLQTIVVNEDYLNTYGMEMTQGRFYSKDFPSDISDAFVVNEAAVKAMGIQSPLGKRFSAWDKDGRIIGVVKDFHFKSLKEQIEPLILQLGPKRRFYQYLTLRINPQNTPEVLSYIKKTWEEHFPHHLYEIHFLDQTIDQLYASEKKIKRIFSSFAFLAVFISCLGLFGLASFLSEQRTKEIGIRKVLGAPVMGIVVLISKDFTKWVLAANVIAWPIAYYAMNQWLQNFAYRITIQLWMFVCAGLTALIIALLTVSWRAVRAASANPINSLRYE
ncbi:MAG: FtsX-like permease family protein [Candidatus Aminicenantes bacterium]|nr:FtsX-like permease family protein [Candidatus Aminicenantes bacterium]